MESIALLRDPRGPGEPQDVSSSSRGSLPPDTVAQPHVGPACVQVAPSRPVPVVSGPSSAPPPYGLSVALPIHTCPGLSQQWGIRSSHQATSRVGGAVRCGWTWGTPASPRGAGAGMRPPHGPSGPDLGEPPERGGCSSDAGWGQGARHWLKLSAPGRFSPQSRRPGEAAVRLGTQTDSFHYGDRRSGWRRV